MIPPSGKVVSNGIMYMAAPCGTGCSAGADSHLLAAAHPPPALGLYALVSKSFDLTIKIETVVMKLGVVHFYIQRKKKNQTFGFPIVFHCVLKMCSLAVPFNG